VWVATLGLSAAGSAITAWRRRQSAAGALPENGVQKTEFSG
jgi:hypothetical protein